MDELPIKPSPLSQRRRGVYLLPNLFTTAALFSGFYAIIAATQDKFTIGAVAIFIAMILDSLDGRVARMTNTQSAFGAEYDSLSDLVSFGLAPGLMLYQWSLVYLRDYGNAWGKIGWLAAFIYVACAALRLARFNTMIGKADKRFFTGLPSPAAAALMAGTVLLFEDLGMAGQSLIMVAFSVTLVAGLLMVSNVSYYSFKDINLHHRLPFMAGVAIMLGFALLPIWPEKALFTIFVLYALSGPALWIARRYKRSQRRKKDEES